MEGFVNAESSEINLENILLTKIFKYSEKLFPILSFHWIEKIVGKIISFDKIVPTSEY